MTNNCPICNGEELSFTIRNYHHYDMLRCATCKGEFAYPFKGPSEEFYDKAADEESTRRHTIKSKWHITHPTRKSPLLTSGAGRTVLDIGCGNGDFAEFAAQQGFNVIGIDIDKTSLQIAQSRNLMNVEFKNMTLFEFATENPRVRFDIIAMFEVFEHVDTPNDTIVAIKKLLKSSGYFIGSLPNEHRFFAKKLNLLFALPPYHLTYWVKDTWHHYLSTKHGLIQHSTSNNVYFGYLTNIIYFKLLKALNVNEKSIVNTILKIIAYPIRKIEALIEKITDKGSSFYFEYKLPSSQKN
jgi:2-polyprenyl-3-methyl-5-hydroxy-6-metoxy-1,4-benzoquinol methylase